jgi:ACR3 family arsenite efflux pump ArsB
MGQLNNLRIEGDRNFGEIELSIDQPSPEFIQQFAMGLILLGLTPCAPLLPMLADRARGDMNYAATFMLLASAVGASR